MFELYEKLAVLASNCKHLLHFSQCGTTHFIVGNFVNCLGKAL